MSTLYENIMSLCEKKGIKGGKLCVDCGISKSTLTSLKTGRTKSISLENAKKIADYFDVPVGVVTGDPMSLNDLTLMVAKENGLDKAVKLLNEQKKQPTVTDGLSDTHIELIELARTLSEEDAAVLLAALKARHK